MCLSIGNFFMKDIKNNSRRASALLKSVANQNRLVILCCLAGGKKSVSDIQKYVDISQSALSQHLARLRFEGIVDYERRNRNIIYFIKEPNVKKIINTLYTIYCKE